MKEKEWRGGQLEILTALEMEEALRNVGIGVELPVVQLVKLCFPLERLLPLLLRQAYREWLGESLDGILVDRGLKTHTRALEIVGSCILLSDQTLAPIYISLEVSASHDGIAAFEVRVGEPGDGALGISGPPCNSGKATRFRQGVVRRIDEGAINWVYTVSSSHSEE